MLIVRASRQVAKAVNESYKSFNANQFPTVVADFQLAPGEARCQTIRVNVER